MDDKFSVISTRDVVLAANLPEYVADAMVTANPGSRKANDGPNPVYDTEMYVVTVRKTATGRLVTYYKNLYDLPEFICTLRTARRIAELISVVQARS